MNFILNLGQIKSLGLGKPLPKMTSLLQNTETYSSYIGKQVPNVF